MPSDDLSTYFAPAARLSGTALTEQIERVVDNQLILRMLDMMPFLVMLLNSQRQSVFINHLLAQQLNLENVNLVLGERPGEILHCIHSQEMAAGCGTSRYCAYCGAVNAIIESERLKQIVEMDCTLTDFNLQTVNLRVSAVPCDMPDGECFTVLVIRDISDSQRRSSLERVFFHDILNMISGLNNLAVKASRDNSSLCRSIGESLSKIANEMTDEINAQRDLVAAEDESLKVSMREILVDDILQSMVDLMRNRFADAGKKLVLSEYSENEILVSDIRLVRRVLVNMLKNALEATNPGETVTILARRNQNWLDFQVHNPGFIPEEIQMQLFNRSFSTKGEGRGIGTYSMKLLTEKYLHGKISFFSDPIDGTTFTASYPAAVTL